MREINLGHSANRRKPGRLKVGVISEKVSKPINTLGRNLYRLLPPPQLTHTFHTHDTYTETDCKDIKTPSPSLNAVQLLEKRSPEAVKVHDLYVVDRLKQKDYRCANRLYWDSNALESMWTFFPVIKSRHFYLIAVHNDHMGTIKIGLYDSMHIIHTEELEAVHDYFRLGTLSPDQVHTLSNNLSHTLISKLTQAQLDAIFLEFSRILAESKIIRLAFQ